MRTFEDCFVKKASYEHNEWHLDCQCAPLLLFRYVILYIEPILTHTHTHIYIYRHIVHVVRVMLCLTCLFRRFIIWNRLVLWGMGGLGEVWGSDAHRQSKPHSDPRQNEVRKSATDAGSESRNKQTTVATSALEICRGWMRRYTCWGWISWQSPVEDLMTHLLSRTKHQPKTKSKYHPKIT